MHISREEFDALAQRVAKLEAKAPKLRQVAKKPQSVREFILEKSPKSQVEMCVCFMYFRDEIQGDDTGFGVAQATKYFVEARERVPQNVADALGKCAKKGWITEAKAADRASGNKYWRITNTGIDYVEKLGGSRE